MPRPWDAIMACLNVNNFGQKFKKGVILVSLKLLIINFYMVLMYVCQYNYVHKTRGADIHFCQGPLCGAKISIGTKLKLSK